MFCSWPCTSSCDLPCSAMA
ncbi:hypothetical protein [Brevibacterium sp. H-BE7]